MFQSRFALHVGPDREGIFPHYHPQEHRRLLNDCLYVVHYQKIVVLMCSTGRSEFLFLFCRCRSIALGLDSRLPLYSTLTFVVAWCFCVKMQPPKICEISRVSPTISVLHTGAFVPDAIRVVYVSLSSSSARLPIPEAFKQNLR